MNAHSPPVQTVDRVEALHQVLRHLDEPARLEKSPWAESNLVRRAQQREPYLTLGQAVKTALSEQLAHLAETDAQLVSLLRGRFWEGLTVAEMVHNNRPEAQSERRFYEQQRLALDHFAALLEQQEQRCRQPERQSRLLAGLPIPTYQRLFGVERYAQQVIECLHDPRRHPILSVKGIGGIGKTALADHTLRQFLAEDQTVHNLLWISAKQEYLSESGIIGDKTRVRIDTLFDELGQKLGLDEVLRLPLSQKIDRLATVLRTQRYLVVLDNLESVEDFRQVVPWLERLATPTQFLLTARETIPALNTITQVDLGELDPAAAMALIEYAAAEKGAGGFTPEDVYALVGGNPLAILLVVSQICYLPAGRVLARVRHGDSDELYSYIFRTSWSVLRDEEKMILFALQRAGDQAEWEWLNLSMGLPSALLDAALGRLRTLSLIQPQLDDAGRRAFAIHRLTSTFLRTEVLGWK